MKILSLFGSPRKRGNSRAMSEAFLGRAEELGAQVERVFLNQLDYRGCQHCDACKNTRADCVLDDDLAPVLAAVHECDTLVMSTPVYYGDVSSQLKAFIDRTYSFLVPGYGAAEVKSRLPAGKKLVLIIAQGHPKEKLFADIYPRYSYFFTNHHRFAQSTLLRSCGVYYLGDAEKVPDELARFARAADELMHQGAD